MTLNDNSHVTKLTFNDSLKASLMHVEISDTSVGPPASSDLLTKFVRLTFTCSARQ